MANGQRAWEQWLARHERPLLLYARQFVPSQADGEDLVQQAILRVLRSGNASPSAPPDVALVYRAVRSAAVDRARQTTRRRTREEAYALWCRPDEPLFQDGVAARERQDEIQAALSELPREQREVLVLRVWSELTFAQIGVALDISQNTAASRYRYALGALRRGLTRELCYGQA